VPPAAADLAVQRTAIAVAHAHRVQGSALAVAPTADLGLLGVARSAGALAASVAVGSHGSSRLRVTAGLIPRRPGVPPASCWRANPPAGRWWLAVVARARSVAAVLPGSAAASGPVTAALVKRRAGVPPLAAGLPGSA